MGSNWVTYERNPLFNLHLSIYNNLSLTHCNLHTYRGGPRNLMKTRAKIVAKGCEPARQAAAPGGRSRRHEGYRVLLAVARWEGGGNCCSLLSLAYGLGCMILGLN
jgi:hypothetical protein